MRRDLRVQVFGPAYLDRVVRVDRPLVAEGDAPLDQSVDGRLTFGTGLKFKDQAGAVITTELPEGWPGPTGEVELSKTLGVETQTVRGVSWHDDLGGMGAGYAAALGGVLFNVLGPEGDPISRDVVGLLERRQVRNRPVRVAFKADWTLLVTSGPFGDKLPVGFRGAYDSVESLESLARGAGECDLRVVAALPNRLAARVLRDEGAGVRLFAPSSRNMTDRQVSVGSFAEWVDILCCNRREWESLEEREQVAWQIPILAITDGPRGSVVRFTTPEGEAGRIAIPAFPRESPPRDTNRAGEAFASTLVSTLLEGGWTQGVVRADLVRRAADRASAAAALTLDREWFGFPTESEIDSALRAGRVGGAD